MTWRSTNIFQHCCLTLHWDKNKVAPTPIIPTFLEIWKGAGNAVLPQAPVTLNSCFLWTPSTTLSCTYERCLHSLKYHKKNELLHVICIYWRFSIVKRDYRTENNFKLTMWLLCSCRALNILIARHVHLAMVFPRTQPWAIEVEFVLPTVILLLPLFSSDFQPSPILVPPALRGKLKIPVSCSAEQLSTTFSCSPLFTATCFHTPERPTKWQC